MILSDCYLLVISFLLRREKGPRVEMIDGKIVIKESSLVMLLKTMAELAF
jgi:hypothetical protein